MMNIFRQIWLVTGIVFNFTAAHAEQDLPIVIVEGKTTYQSQLNYVKAFDSNTKKIIWKTVLYQNIEPDTYIPGLERDVQWVVIKELKIKGSLIQAIDSKTRVYFVNKVTGKIENK